MRGGEVGNATWKGECLFDDERDDDEYNVDDEYDNVEDGKGSRRGADDGGIMMVATSSPGRPLAAWGIGH